MAAEPIARPADVAISLGMITNEFVIDPCKCACSAGALRIGPTQGGDGAVVLSIADDGRGLPPEPGAVA